jgi:predicted sulfurtransferase
MLASTLGATDLDSLFNTWQTTSDSLTIKINNLDSLIKNDKVIFVDIRANREIKVSKIENSITIKEFESMVKKPNFNKSEIHFIAYCTVGYRSGKFTQKYTAKGFNVLNLWGGILDWVRQERPVLDPKKNPTLEVHTYSEEWEFIPSKYKAIN